MIDIIGRFYAYAFAKPYFTKLNLLLYHLGLRGLGVLNYQNDYLSGEGHWLRSYLGNKEKPVVFDVGANVGNYSRRVIAANPYAEIYAFEPHPMTFQKLTSNIKSKNFSALNVGVSSAPGFLNLFDYAQGSGSSHASFFKEAITDLHGAACQSFQVEAICLDDFIEKEKILDIDLLKIDTEGSELNALRGALGSLGRKRIKAIQIEFNEMNIISRASFKDFWDMLKDYEIYRLLPGGKLIHLHRYSPVNCEVYAYQNIIALLKVN